MEKLSIKDMVLIAMFTALTAIGAYLTIPLEPVSITFQVVFCLLAGLLLNKRLAAWSQVLYVVVGLVGLPVFAGGSGGTAYIFKPSFGFVLGFVAAAYVTGWVREKISIKNRAMSIGSLFLATCCGLAVLYLIGLPYMYLIFAIYLEKTLSLFQLLTLGFFPFIIFDLLKCFAAALLGHRLLPIIKNI